MSVRAFGKWMSISLLAIAMTMTSCAPLALGQDDREGASSSDGQAIWNKTEYPIVRTLAELRRMQREVGKKDFEVDLQAQLTFAARYWSVFFVQDGDIPAMVFCTDAASAILRAQPMGKWLRIRGLVYTGQTTISLVGFELLPEVQPIEPLRFKQIPKITPEIIDRVVELPCRLLEVMDRKEQSILFGEVDHKFIELHIERFLEPEQYRAVNSQAQAIARGTLNPKFGLTRFTRSAIRMIGTDQLQVVDPSQVDPSLNSPTEQTSVQGRILFTDGIDQIVVGAKDSTWHVTTRFAEHIKTGAGVEVRGKMQGQDNTQRLTAQHIKLLGDSPLSESVELSIGAWEQAKVLPHRVSLEAIVDSQSTADGLRYYQMRSANKRFTAIVNERADPRELFRSGDRIHLTGAPLVDLTAPIQSVERLKLYVIAPSDTQFVSAPFQLSMSHFLWAIASGTILVGVAFSWNWLLRRKVNERTKGLKKLSSHLRMSFDAISEAVLVTDAERRLSSWNRQFEKLFGEVPVENQSIDLPLNVIRKRLADPAALAPIARAGESQSTEPVSVTLTLNNPPQVVHAFVAGIIDSDNTYHGHIYTFEDVTETQRLEGELIQSQKMDAIGQLSGGVAHDFNNLLTIVSSNLALIKFTDNAATAEYVCAADTAVRRAAELTQQLLDFSRRSKLEIQVVNLNDLVGRISTLLRRTFDQSVSLQIELCSTPLFASVDVNRLEQVLINIFINARDALKGRNGKITVRVSPAGDDGNGDEPFARIEIQDNGCGMTREVQARIFDPFFTTKKPGEGTGLGLSMAHGVVEQLGGRIYCESKVDVGTRFRIELPLAELSDSRSENLPAVDRSSEQHLRILLVDDEVLVRSAGAALLSGLGHLPDTAASGQEALDKLEAETFDVVLLDLTMPNMSGKEAYVQIHRRWPDLPVAICTGYHVDLPTWNKDCEIAPPKIISKPYSVETLCSFLNKIRSRRVAGIQ